MIVRQSSDVRASVANLSPRNFDEFTMRKFRDTSTNVARQSRDSLDKTFEHLATIWRGNNTKRHSYECRETLSRCRATVMKIKLHSWERRETLSRMSHDSRATIARQPRDIYSKLDQNSRICRINVHLMRLQRESCVYIVNL